MRFLQTLTLTALSFPPLPHESVLRYNTAVAFHAPVAQGIEQRTSNPSVAGSNPAGRTIFLLMLRVTAWSFECFFEKNVL